MGRLQVLAAHHLVHEAHRPVPARLVTCRIDLSRSRFTLGGTAACSQAPLRLLNPIVCHFIYHRTSQRGSALSIRPFIAQPARLLWPRLTSVAPSRLFTEPVALRQNNRPPGVRRVTFAPSTCRIYNHPVRMTSGFRYFCLLAHCMIASYAISVRQARALP